MPALRVKEPEYIAARWANLRAVLRQQKLPALLVTNFSDVSYLTGFEGDDSFVLITPGRVELISDFRYDEQIARECPWVGLTMRRRGIAEEIAKLVRRLKIRKLAVQAESMTIAQRDGLAGLLKGQVRLVPANHLVVDLRHIKDQREIGILENAIAVAQAGFEMLRGQLKIGMSENQIASLLVSAMRARGALNASFETIVAVGPNGSLPHYRPGDVALTSNTSLLVDWGARMHGYCSDLTRVLLLGKVHPKIREIYKIVLDAQRAAIAAIQPGKPARVIDKVARDIIKQAGYEKNFGHGLGHGIGRDIHEAISLSRMSKVTLRPGMVVTVEPGIYLPGLGGVRIEDDILVTDTGCRVLSSLPKSLEYAALEL